MEPGEIHVLTARAPLLTVPLLYRSYTHIAYLPSLSVFHRTIPFIFISFQSPKGTGINWFPVAACLLLAPVMVW